MYDCSKLSGLPSGETRPPIVPKKLDAVIFYFCPSSVVTIGPLRMTCLFHPFRGSC